MRRRASFWSSSGEELQTEYLLPREHAAKALEFYTHPAWRAYISSYSSGYELCKAWVADDTARFKRLLTERLSTRDLQA